MTPLLVLVSAIVAPLVTGLFTLLLPRKAVGARVALALCGPLAALALLGLHVLRHGAVSTPMLAANQFAMDWMPLLELNLQLNPDQLGLFFAFLVSGIGLLITIYARAYFGPDREALYRFYPSLHLFMTAMIGVALADNFMLLLLFWEMTSISSFLLIGWDRDDPAAVRKAMQAFIVTALGGLAMMGGLILMGLHTGAWSFSELLALTQAGRLVLDGTLTTAFALVFVGAAAKSAQWPLHFWLPGAMAAPTPVSAYLHSATMVKAGVYLVGRLWPMLALLPLWPMLIVPIGALTMVLGAFIALQKQDLKQIFAYTTVSQLGLLMCMYGLAHFEYHGQPNLLWDVTQILNHAFYKAPLFILAGAIGHVASRQLPELRGFFYRGRDARIMTVVLLLAAYALAAGPGTLSFTAKELFFYQVVHAVAEAHSSWLWLLIPAGIATGMFNVAIFLRLGQVLLARPEPRGALDVVRPHGNGHHTPSPPAHAHASAHAAAHPSAHAHAEHHHERGLWGACLWMPGLALVAFQYLGGLVPGAYESLFGWLDPNRFNYDFHPSLRGTHLPMTWDAHWGAPLWMSLAAMALGAALGFAPILRRVLSDPHDHLYPGFYTLCTKGGGRVFRLFQRGHAGFYVGMVFLAMVMLFGWSVGFSPERLRLPEEWAQQWRELHDLKAVLPAILWTVLVCVGSVLLPVISDRPSRVLVLGAVGFAVSGVYYLYQAPDLALTQISIEIVSLILFLLVLSLLPNVTVGPDRRRVGRMVAGALVGVMMAWLTFTSSVGSQPAMSPTFHKTGGGAFAHLGEFFLRNSYKGVDTLDVPADKVYGGVVDRGAEHVHSFSGAHDKDLAAPAHKPSGPDGENVAQLHKGGGGKNSVNVILVDTRGFDTMGEITVLGLAALGVWTLLRRLRHEDAPATTAPAKSEPRVTEALPSPSASEHL